MSPIVTTRVDIVTIAKDNPIGLKATVESLVKQKFKSWRCLIVVPKDSLETLNVAEETLSDERFAIIHDEGNGVYEAMNFAISKCNSDYIWFMNAGDRFFSESSLEFAYSVAEELDADLVVGKHKIINPAEMTSAFTERRRAKIKKLHTINFAMNRRSGCHQAMLFRESLIKRIGGYSKSYQFASDFNLALKIIDSGKAFRVNRFIALIEPGGLADMNLGQVFQEKHHARVEFFRTPLMTLLSFTWTVLAKLNLTVRQFLRARI